MPIVRGLECAFSRCRGWHGILRCRTPLGLGVHGLKSLNQIGNKGGNMLLCMGKPPQPKILLGIGLYGFKGGGQVGQVSNTASNKLMIMRAGQ